MGRTSNARRTVALAPWVLSLTFLTPSAPVAQALDMFVESAQVNQQIQLGTTTLVAGRPTFVRAIIDTGNQNIPGVDARLHVAVNGVPLPESPLASINGPITATVFPSLLNENQTLNFFFVPPQAGDVDLVIEINPPSPARIPESDYTNNFFPIADREFECRKIPELIYVPVDYRPTGSPLENLPDPVAIGFNQGAAFVRGIYPTPDWNYHQWPTPPLLWTDDINNSASQFHNFLSLTRTSTIPGLGYPVADFIYGWFPGNPCTCNGQANGVPGDAAFGNSQLIRHQRTFAHELGHLLGMLHVNNTIGTVGVDVEHHLGEPLPNIGRIKSPNLFTIMVAGQLTQSAWINSSEYEFTASRFVLQCGNQANQPLDRLMHVTGVYDNRTKTVSLNPIFEVSGHAPTQDTPNPNVLVEAYGGVALGEPLIHRVSINASSAADRCDAPNERHETSAFNVLIPTQGAGIGAQVDRITLRDANDGRLLAERKRSAHTPTATITKPQFATVIDKPTRIEWTGSDSDGDPLTYSLLYSHNNGHSWFVLRVLLTENHFDLDPARIAGSRPGQGRLRLVSSDGMNNSVTEVGSLTFVGSTPPHVEIIYPNESDEFLALSPVMLHGSSWDAEDLAVTDDDLSWSSDIDGELTTGSLLLFDRLSIGEHVLTLTATDSDGMIGTDSINITVNARDVDQGDCNSNGIGDLDDILSGFAADCDHNQIPDDCDIADNTLHDLNTNTVPDECEGLGDFDDDGDRDLSDFESFLNCVDDPGTPVAPGCSAADIDADLDVDFADYGAFVQIYSGHCGVTFTQQPANAAACTNESASFQASATGEHVRYQWVFENEPIPGANEQTLVVNNATPSVAGTYSVLAFDRCGVVASNPVELLVAQPPTIDVHPADAIICPGESATFSVDVTGAGTLTYQWQLNGQDIPGATNPQLVVTNANQDDLGLYRCIVTDSCPSSSTSQSAELEFFTAVAFNLQPIGGEICVGGTIFLVASADGSVSFQWLKDGVPIPGATSFLLAIPNATEADSGAYSLVVTGECDSGESDPAIIDVVPCGPNP